MKTNDKTTKQPKRVYETFTVNRSLIGWFLVPADAQHFPLLTKLYGEEGDTCPGVREPMKWESLAEGLELLRRVAKSYRVGLRLCGNLKVRPVVQLWELATPAAPEPMVKVFEGPDLRGDAAKWGISDFYEEHEAALRAILAGRKPFTTGWYSVKKEIQTGRVWRERTNGPVFIEASASMDDWPDLVDTAVWAAMGKQLGASGGFDTLLKLGMSEKEADRWVDRLAQEQEEYSELGEDNSTSRSAKLAFNVSYETLCDRLDGLVDECSQELESVYESLTEYCRELLEREKRSRGVSCSNCRYFHAVIPESRMHPEDPADCGHPKYFALLSANKAFPFEHGCKFWEARGPMKPTEAELADGNDAASGLDEGAEK